MYLYIYAVTRVWARPVVTWIESITEVFRLTCAVRVSAVITVVATPNSLHECVTCKFHPWRTRLMTAVMTCYTL